MAHEPLPEDARVALVTAPDMEVARALARSLVGARLAACVNLLPGLESVYRWKDGVEEEGEVLLIVKTTRARLPELLTALAREHPYEVPECIALAPAEVEPRYLEWLFAASAPAGPGGA